jgi:MFS family permease
MLFLGFVMMVAIMSIEPIIAFYVAEIDPDPLRVPVVAGLAMSAAALGSVLSAPPLGRLADRIGHRRVLVGALIASAALLIPQAFVNADWQLVGLRFLMGLALGAILPGMTAILRRSAPDDQVGRLLGLPTSIQYVGQVLGPSAGGAIGAHVGMRAVFLATSVLMAASAAATRFFAPGERRSA